MPPRADRFPLFDSLRAIAALAIVFTHVGSFGGVARPGGEAVHWTGALAVAVPIFLTISGFLLYRPFAARRMRDGGVPSIKAYGWRRVLRIIPAYWVALAGVGLWLGSNYLYHLGDPPPEIFSPHGFLAYFGFLQVYSAETRGGGIPQAWTIDIEVVFYLVLPLFAIGALGLARRYRMGWRGELGALAGVMLISLLHKLIVVSADDGLDTVPVTPLPLLSSYPAYADHLALGMAIAVLSVGVASTEVPPRWVGLIDRKPWLPWLISALAFVMLAKGIGMDGSPNERITHVQYFVRHLLFAVLAGCLVLPAVFGDQSRGWVRKHVLGNRALSHFGMVSYGVYLWHLAWIIQLKRWDLDAHLILGSWITWLGAAVLGAWALGSLSYYLVEKPALSLRHRVPDRSTPEPVPEPAP